MTVKAPYVSILARKVHRSALGTHSWVQSLELGWQVMFVFAWINWLRCSQEKVKWVGAGGGRGRHSGLGWAAPERGSEDVWPPSLAGRKNKPAWAGICDIPAAQILRHCRPAAEQIGSEWFQLLSQPHDSGQRLCVEVQHGILLLDVNQRLFVHILQKLLGLLGHLQNKLWSSVLVSAGESPSFPYVPALPGNCTLVTKQ